MSHALHSRWRRRVSGEPAPTPATVVRPGSSGIGPGVMIVLYQMHVLACTSNMTLFCQNSCCCGVVLHIFPFDFWERTPASHSGAAHRDHQYMSTPAAATAPTPATQPVTRLRGLEPSGSSTPRAQESLAPRLSARRQQNSFRRAQESSRSHRSGGSTHRSARGSARNPLGTTVATPIADASSQLAAALPALSTSDVEAVAAATEYMASGRGERPVATPMTTPQATPYATPQATPQATPKAPALAVPQPPSTPGGSVALGSSKGTPHEEERMPADQSMAPAAMPPDGHVEPVAAPPPPGTQPPTLAACESASPSAAARIRGGGSTSTEGNDVELAPAPSSTSTAAATRVAAVSSESEVASLREMCDELRMQLEESHMEAELRVETAVKREQVRACG